MVIAVLTLIHTIISYLEIDTAIISYIIALLVWLFLYLSSFVFKFCLYHRMFLYYILLINIINLIDYEYGIPLGLRPMIALQIIIAGIFLIVILYLKQHDKLPFKEDIGEDSKRIR